MSPEFKPKNSLDSFDALLEIVERLRAPGGCPWDREQTHASLKRNLLEECYEVLEAIDQGDPAKLAEELGDLLVQVAFHCQIAREAQEFQPGDVLREINEKLVRRHPHVFGGTQVADSREAEHQWEKLKQQEKESRSPTEGIPSALPALAHAQLMQDRVAKAGFDWDSLKGVVDMLSAELEELRKADTREERAWEVGDLLFSVVNLSRWLDVHAEDALRQANARFKARYQAMEELARQRGQDFGSLTMEEKDKLWREVKEGEGKVNPGPPE